MSGKNYLVIDQGGQSTRALLFDQHGEILQQAAVAIATQREGRERVEHDASEIIDSINRVILEATADIDASRIDSVGLACQRSSIVCWDKHSGAALSPVLSWQDRRASALIDNLADAAADIHARSGLFLSPHYGASKLRWCLDHLPEVKRAGKAQRLACGPLSSFILYKILEEQPLLVDPVCASRMLLWNLQSRDWDPQLLKLFDIPVECLPECVPNQHPFGHLKAGIKGRPLTVCTGDQAAALFMAGPPEPDTLYINIGTGAFLQRPLANEAIFVPTLLSSVTWQSDKALQYVLEGTVNGAASALQTIGKELGLNAEQIQTQSRAALSKSDTKLLFLNAISGLGSPFWQADFPSRFIGEGNIENKLLAVLESILFLIKANLDEMNRYHPAPEHLVITGGLSALDGLCQRLASLCNLDLQRCEQTEATARGLACLLAPDEKFNDTRYTHFKTIQNPALHERYQKWMQLLTSQLKEK